jgi:2-polyprenyl-6-methoxyphenol hydroxylase-like FAD-dependent oxidoreductase
MSTVIHRSHAVVIGASMAGLLTARVLSEHFERVTIVERDQLPEGAEFRRGVPQSNHLHTLMPGGRDVVEALLPGFEAELVGAGATIVRWPQDGLWLTPAGWSQRFDTPRRHRLFGVTRALIELIVRRRVLRLDGVEVIERVEASRLVPGPRGVAGIEIRDRGDREGASARRLAADLVVDASGRTSRTPDWLEALGYGRPQETYVNSFLGYATREFVRPANGLDHWKGLYLMANPPRHARTGLLFPIEGAGW